MASTRTQDFRVGQHGKKDGWANALGNLETEFAKTGLVRLIRRQRNTLSHRRLSRLTFVLIELKVEILLGVRDLFQRFQRHCEQAVTIGAHPNRRDRASPLNHSEITLGTSSSHSSGWLPVLSPEREFRFDTLYDLLYFVIFAIAEDVFAEFAGLSCRQFATEVAFNRAATGPAKPIKVRYRTENTGLDLR